MRFLMLLTLLACKQDQELSKRTDVQGASDWPKAVVEPGSLNFGDLSYLQSAEQLFTISNQGTDNSILHIEEILHTAGADAGYTMLLPVECTSETECDLALNYGESVEVIVTLTATQPGDLPGEILVKSDDEDNPAIPVPLIGRGLWPAVAVDPPSTTYPDTTVGCETVQEFTITNVGTDMVEVTEIVHDGPGYAVIERPSELPLLLDPGAAVSVSLGFAPGDEGTFEGELVVGSNDPRGEQRATFVGNGVVPGTQHVTHTVPALDKLDLLVMVDKSYSMTDDRTTLASNAQSFAETLSGMGRDIQVMVVTEQDGCNTGGILTPDMADFAAKFQSAVLEGEENTWSEALLYLSKKAIDQTDEFMCNAEFLRSDAMLHAIIISDEDDSGPVDWFEVVSDLRVKKGAQHLVKFSGVIGLPPSGCETETNTAAPGRRYASAIEETDGQMISLCDNWAPQLNTAATQQITRDAFPLLGLPDELTIGVMVDGLRRTSDWYYMSDINSVIFEENLPYSGQTVDITYEVPLTCE